MNQPPPRPGPADVGPMVTDNGPAPWIRWMAVPYAVLVVVIAALALNAESRDSFVERQGDEDAIERLTDDEIPPDATRLVIETPEGRIEITTDGERVVGEDATGSAEVLRLYQDPDGDIIGFRVNPDGTFSPVRVGEDTEGATIIVPNDSGGFDLVKPDGTRVRVDVDNGDLAAGEIGEDGFTPLERSEDGSFQLDDDLFASPGTLDRPDVPPPSEPGAFPWTTVLIALAAAAALGLGIWFFIAFSPRVSTVGDTPVEQLFAAAPMVRRDVTGDPWAAFEAFLVELSAEPDPSQAILLAFAYAEAGIGVVPARARDETPYEWHRRVRTIDPQVASLLMPLLERYVAIRFGGHVAEDPERRRAIDDLRQLTYTACGATDRLAIAP